MRPGIGRSSMATMAHPIPAGRLPRSAPVPAPATPGSRRGNIAVCRWDPYQSHLVPVVVRGASAAALLRRQLTGIVVQWYRGRRCGHARNPGDGENDEASLRIDDSVRQHPRSGSATLPDPHFHEEVFDGPGGCRAAAAATPPGAAGRAAVHHDCAWIRFAAAQGTSADGAGRLRVISGWAAARPPCECSSIASLAGSVSRSGCTSAPRCHSGGSTAPWMPKYTNCGCAAPSVGGITAYRCRQMQ